MKTLSQMVSVVGVIGSAVQMGVFSSDSLLCLQFLFSVVPSVSVRGT
jgi:hypothetical protein